MFRCFKCSNQTPRTIALALLAATAQIVFALVISGMV